MWRLVQNLQEEKDAHVLLLKIFLVRLGLQLFCLDHLLKSPRVPCTESPTTINLFQQQRTYIQLLIVARQQRRTSRAHIIQTKASNKIRMKESVAVWLVGQYDTIQHKRG